jgi:hypothetical protein
LGWLTIEARLGGSPDVAEAAGTGDLPQFCLAGLRLRRAAFDASIVAGCSSRETSFSIE